MASARKNARKEGSDNFEFSLKRLEEIVELLEGGSISLDESMKIYEEGVILSKKCLEKLSHAELKLKRLTKDIEGNFELFDDDKDE